MTDSGTGECLNVTGGQVRLLCPATATDRTWSVCEATLPRGAGPPPHDHPWDEGYYVVAGTIQFTVGDREILARPGDFLYIPAGTPHGFAGASDEPARVVVFDCPAAAEGFFRDVDREVEEFPRDAHKIPEIGLRHRLRFTG